MLARSSAFAAVAARVATILLRHARLDHFSGNISVIRREALCYETTITVDVDDGAA